MLPSIIVVVILTAAFTNKLTSDKFSCAQRGRQTRGELA